MAQWNEKEHQFQFSTATLATDRRVFLARGGDYIVEGISFAARVFSSSGGSGVLDLMVCKPGIAAESGISILAAPIALETTKAASALTTDATAPANNSTITIGGVIYTFKTTLTNSGTTGYEVLIGASVDEALDNLGEAIAAAGTPGTNFGSNTPVNPDVTVTANTDTVLTATAIHAGAAANKLATKASTSPNSHLTWTGTTMGGGTVVGLGYDIDTIFDAVLSATPSALVIPQGCSLACDFDGTLTNLVDLACVLFLRKVRLQSN